MLVFRFRLAESSSQPCQPSSSSHGDCSAWLAKQPKTQPVARGCACRMSTVLIYLGKERASSLRSHSRAATAAETQSSSIDDCSRAGQQQVAAGQQKRRQQFLGESAGWRDVHACGGQEAYMRAEGRACTWGACSDVLEWRDMHACGGQEAYMCAEGCACTWGVCSHVLGWRDMHWKMKVDQLIWKMYACVQL